MNRGWEKGGRENKKKRDESIEGWIEGWMHG